MPLLSDRRMTAEDVLVTRFGGGAVDALEEAGAVAAGVGGVGLKVVCPTPNPNTDASVPVPEIVT